MSKIHVLESDNNYGYRVAIHFATPSGNNSVGMSWKDCGLAAGSFGSTVLEVGTGPGNVSQAEYDSIIAGDTIELVRVIMPGTSPSNAAVLALSDIMISEYQAGMASTLKYYGHEIVGA